MSVGLRHVKTLPCGLLHEGMVHRWKDAKGYAEVVAEAINKVMVLVACNVKLPTIVLFGGE